MTEAFRSASSEFVVARMFLDNVNSEQWVGFLCATLMPLWTSSRLVRMTTSARGSFLATKVAMAVPNEPEPKTQIFFTMSRKIGVGETFWRPFPLKRRLASLHFSNERERHQTEGGRFGVARGTSGRVQSCAQSTFFIFSLSLSLVRACLRVHSFPFSRVASKRAFPLTVTPL